MQCSAVHFTALHCTADGGPALLLLTQALATCRALQSQAGRGRGWSLYTRSNSHHFYTCSNFRHFYTRSNSLYFYSCSSSHNFYTQSNSLSSDLRPPSSAKNH